MAMTRESSTGDLINLIPQLSQMAHQTGMDRDQLSLAQQKQTFEQDMAKREMALKERELQQQQAGAAGAQGVASVPNSTQAIGPPGGSPGASGGNTSMATDMSTNLA
jgi:hypothetical protein